MKKTLTITTLAAGLSAMLALALPPTAPSARLGGVTEFVSQIRERDDGDLGLTSLEPASNGQPVIKCTRDPVGERGELFGAGLYLPRWHGQDHHIVNWDSSFMLDARFPIREHARALRQSGASLRLRFGHQPFDGILQPNGSVTRGYDWRSALDREAGQVSIDDYIAYVRATDSEAQVVVNFATASSSDASDLAAYTNGTDPSDPMVALRISRGHADPYGIDLWELGNEQYGDWAAGNRSLPDRPRGAGSADPSIFGRRAAEFAQAMRARSASPIRVLAPLENWELNYYGLPGIQAVVRTSGHAVDGYVIHFYPESGMREIDAGSMVGAVALFEENLARTQAAINSASDGKQFELAVTEWAPTALAADEGWKWSTGLLTANTLMAMARRQISVANYFAVASAPSDTGSYSYWLNGDTARPTPALLATHQTAAHIGAVIYSSGVSGSPAGRGHVPVSGEFAYSHIDALCSGGASDARGPQDDYTIIVNRSAASQRVNVEWRDRTYARIRVSQIAGAPTDSRVEPIVREYESSTSFSITVPAWSASFLTFRAAGAP